MMINNVKPSRYIEAGSPQRCFLPSCKNLFDDSCFRGEDNHFYCSDVCALTTVEPLRKRG
jgi:hypothetical protein